MALPFFPEKKDQPTVIPERPQKLSRKSAALVRPKNVAISNILSEELVIKAPDGAGKDELIEILVTRLCERKGLGVPAPFLAKVLEREQGISTTLDTGCPGSPVMEDGYTLCGSLGGGPENS